jgi:hypothetical protein
MLNDTSDVQQRKEFAHKIRKFFLQKLKDAGFVYPYANVYKGRKKGYTITFGGSWRRKITEQRPSTSNVKLDCPICFEKQFCYAITPCGHLICKTCYNEYLKTRNIADCPVCKTHVTDLLALFSAV